MTLEVIHPIESPEQIADYYKIIHKAIGGNTDDGLWLVKQKNWIAAIAYDGYFYSNESEKRFVQTLSNFSYTELIAITWSKAGLTPPVYIIPATVDGMEDFRCNYYNWYVWFAGNPDWFILLANTLDFIIVAGQPDFVHQILGCEPNEASIDIREMSESEYLDPVVRKYYTHLLEEIQITYSKAEPGTVINIGLLNWDEAPQVS